MDEITNIDDKTKEQIINPEPENAIKSDQAEAVNHQQETAVAAGDDNADKPANAEPAKIYENPPIEPSVKVGEITTLSRAMINTRANKLNREQKTSSTGSVRELVGYSGVYSLLCGKDFRDTWRGNPPRPIPLNESGSMPFVRVDEKGALRPSRNGAEGAFGLKTVLSWGEASRDSVVCMQSDGTHVIVPVQTLLDAHLVTILDADNDDQQLDPNERVMLKARVNYAIDGSTEFIDTLFEDPAHIVELADKMNLVTIDDLRGYLRKTVPEITPPKNGQLTEAQIAENSRRAEVRANLEKKFATQSIATPELIADVVVDTINPAELDGQKDHIQKKLDELNALLLKIPEDHEKYKSVREAVTAAEQQLQFIELFKSDREVLKRSISDQMNILQSGQFDEKTSANFSSMIRNGDADGFLKALQEQYKDNLQALEHINQFQQLFENKYFVAGGLIAFVGLILALQGLRSAEN